MSSTNICIGLGSGRSSSRVIKPPGGGHSEIFISDTRDEKKIERVNSSSQMRDIFASEETKTVTVHKAQTQQQTVTVVEETSTTVVEKESKTFEEETSSVDNETGVVEQETTTVEAKKEEPITKTEEKKVEVPVPMKTGRIPPGGFSTPLW